MDDGTWNWLEVADHWLARVERQQQAALRRDLIRAVRRMGERGQLSPPLRDVLIRLVESAAELGADEFAETVEAIYREAGLA